MIAQTPFSEWHMFGCPAHWSRLRSANYVQCPPLTKYALDAQQFGHVEDGTSEAHATLLRYWLLFDVLASWIFSVSPWKADANCLNVPTLSYSSPMGILNFLSPLQSQTRTCFEGSLFSLLIRPSGILCSPLRSLAAVFFADPFEEVLKQLSLRQRWLGMGRLVTKYGQWCYGGVRWSTNYDKPRRNWL
jgi:hypothetical protein